MFLLILSFPNSTIVRRSLSTECTIVFPVGNSHQTQQHLHAPRLHFRDHLLSWHIQHSSLLCPKRKMAAPSCNGSTYNVPVQNMSILQEHRSIVVLQHQALEWRARLTLHQFVSIQI
jgi:hypothetical protein